MSHHESPQMVNRKGLQNSSPATSQFTEKKPLKLGKTVWGNRKSLDVQLEPGLKFWFCHLSNVNTITYPIS